MYYEQQAILNALPGSVIYGPGFQYNTNFVPDIVKETFGSDQPDLILCYVNDRRLLGQPMDSATIVRYGLEGDMCIFPTGLERVDIPKIIWINDLWSCTLEEWDRILLGNKFEFALATYSPPFVRDEVFVRFISRRVRSSVRFIPWPRAICPAIYRDYCSDKIYDVTLLGALQPEGIYPLRNLMRRVFATRSDINFFHQDHPGYRYVATENVLVGERYARVINQSKIFATCTSVYRIPIMKLYEALACRSLLLSDAPCGAEFLGLVDGETFASVDNDNFLQKTMWYLANPGEIDRVSKAGMQLFQDRHTTDVRAEEFCEVATALLSGKDPGSYAQLFSPEQAVALDRSVSYWGVRKVPIPSKLANRWTPKKFVRKILSALKKKFTNLRVASDIKGKRE
ncbi:MAG: glycosyltransferase [Armatimonadota bacterium]|nr:glycosyltransferase [Armatimonadota bacterium]